MNETQGKDETQGTPIGWLDELEANETLTREEKDELIIIATIRVFMEVSNNFSVKIRFDSGILTRLYFFDDGDTGGNGGTSGEKPPPKIDGKAKEHIRRLYALAQAVRARERERQRAYRRRRRTAKGAIAP